MATEQKHAFTHQVMESGWELRPPISTLDRIVETVETDDGSWQIGIATFDARGHDKDFGIYGPTYVMALGYEAVTSRAYDTQPWQAAAEKTMARIIIVDTPGFGDESAPLRTGFGLKLARGDLQQPAELMIKALGQSDLLRDNEEVSLLGYSLGGLTIANMADILQRPSAGSGIPYVRIAGVYLLDPSSPRFVKTLSSDIQADRDSLPFYQGINRRYDWLVAPPEITDPKAAKDLLNRQLAARALYGIAMARNRGNPALHLANAAQEDRYSNVTGLSEGTIRVIRGGLSHIALEGPTNRLLEAVRSQLHPAGRADQVTLPGEQHFWPIAVPLTAAASEHLQ
jgi:pimeloyl-ACP methyl ester carboxylesterase